MATGQDRIHRKFSPSQTERLRLCLGSANLIERIPPRERTKYSEEGDIAHAVLEVGLQTFCATGTQAIENSIYCCQDFPNDFTNAITDALQYAWGVMEYLNTHYGDAVLHTETFVDPPVASAPGEAGGYCDFAISSKKARLLYVVDYKHGVGITKEVLDNAQVTQYAAGFVYDPNSPINPQDVNSVVLAIVQPRAFHERGPIREHTVSLTEIHAFLVELDDLISRAKRDDAPLNPGLEQCQFCEARSGCPALEARALAVINPSLSRVEQVNLNVLPDPKTMDIQRLAYIKSSFDMFDMWKKSINDHIDELLRHGTEVPGWKLVEPSPRREYYGDEAERAQKLAALIGCRVDELYINEMKPLTEVEKMMAEAFKKRVGRSRRKQAAQEAHQLFAYFTIKKPSNSLTLVPEDDPRPAINRAIRAFDGLNFNVPPSPYIKGDSQ